MFHLFAGLTYYPMSGLGDYIGSYQTQEEAETEGKQKIDSNQQWPVDWYTVITESNGVLVQVR